MTSKLTYRTPICRRERFLTRTSRMSDYPSRHSAWSSLRADAHVNNDRNTRSTPEMKPKNTICLWFDKNAHEAARFYAATFPNSEVTAVHKAPGDFPSGKEGDV